MTRMIASGEAAPWFHARALSGNPRYTFDTAAGRWIVMLFAGSVADERARSAVDLVKRNRELFDDRRACFFGVTIDPGDAAERRIAQQLPGIRWFLDYDHALSTLYGAAKREEKSVTYAPHWLLLDPMLRVRGRAALQNGAAIMVELGRRLGQPNEVQDAPVLVVPDVLPSEMCRHLIALYEQYGGKDSGFMREVNGITVTQHNHTHKRRSDHDIEDQRLIATLKAHLSSKLTQMIQRGFQFNATRIERFIVACYDAEFGGHFRPHRDNTTKGTAHRKFACTINLNADEYDGGDLSFPEFGPRTYRATTGGAIVFSCSILHEATPVTSGRRYAFLPFFYDDEGARLRERNLSHVAPTLQSYKSGLPPEDTKASS